MAIIDEFPQERDESGKLLLLEVIEYAPRVTVGRDFRLCGRHLVPEITRDRRPVAPTTKDRQEMLNIVLRVVEQKQSNESGDSK